MCDVTARNANNLNIQTLLRPQIAAPLKRLANGS